MNVAVLWGRDECDCDVKDDDDEDMDYLEEDYEDNEIKEVEKEILKSGDFLDASEDPWERGRSGHVNMMSK